MTIVAFAEVSFLIIQGATIVRNESARDVDLTAFSVLLVMNVMWALYGKFIVHDTPLYLSGLLYVIGSMFVIGGIIAYGDGEDKKSTKNV